MTKAAQRLFAVLIIGAVSTSASTGAAENRIPTCDGFTICFPSCPGTPETTCHDLKGGACNVVSASCGWQLGGQCSTGEWQMTLNCDYQSIDP